MASPRTLLALGLLLPLQAVAAPQAASAAAAVPASLEFKSYIGRVLESNPDLAAARENVAIAEAQIPIAKEWPDPEVTAGLTQLELTHQGNPTGTGLQLSVPIELGGKRGARIAVAHTGVEAARFDYDEAVRSMRATGTNAFADSLHARLVVAQKGGVFSSLQRLVAINERRLAAGDVAEAALLQSRVEAQQFRAEVIDASGEVKATDLALLQLLGPGAPVASSNLELTGDLRKVASTVDPEELLRALERRSDVRAAIARVELAARQVKLEEARRVIDVSVGAGWQHNFSAPGTPSTDFVGASLTIPIPFSRIYRGELDAALASKRQAESQLRAVRVRAESEVRQALARFAAAAERVSLFESGTLGDAKSVLEKTLYNYQRGGATLVEVLIAQRTESDVELAYFDAMADRAHALAGVEQASGVVGLVAF